MAKAVLLGTVLSLATCSAFRSPLFSTGSVNGRCIRCHPSRGRLVNLRAQQQPEQAAALRNAPRVVVVGGGFAGLGSAYHLSKQGYNVTLLDASPNPGGIIKDSKGNTIEAGVKGFWYQYGNIFKLLNDLGIKTEGKNSELTEWSTSSFFSLKGREVDSVVFQSKPRLPTPLGQFVHTLPTFARLSIGDRLSLWRLAFALLEYQDEYEKYDSMSVADLMKRNGVSPQLVRISKCLSFQPLS